MEQHSFLRYSVAVLLFLALFTSSTQGIKITPNYDKPEKQLKLIETRGDLVLRCDFQDANHNTLEWSKNDVAVSAESSLKSRYVLGDRTFTIEKPLDSDAGNYTCTIKGTKDSATFKVLAMVRARLPANSAVVENEKLTLHCLVIGTDPEIKWTIHDNITIDTSMNRYILQADEENKVKNAKLIIESAELTDRGNYTCEVTNDAVREMNRSPLSVTTYLRVKGKYAALWPFLGICAEVVVLCAIILIYEKRRNKADLEESDTDQSPEQKSDHKDSDVRQRK